MSEYSKEFSADEIQALNDLRDGILYIKNNAGAADFLKRSLDKIVATARESVLVEGIDAAERDIRARIYHALDRELSDFLTKKESATRKRFNSTKSNLDSV